MVGLLCYQPFVVWLLYGLRSSFEPYLVPLTDKVLKKVGFIVSDDDIHKIVNCERGWVERVIREFRYQVRGAAL